MKVSVLSLAVVAGLVQQSTAGGGDYDHCRPNACNNAVTNRGSPPLNSAAKDDCRSFFACNPVTTTDCLNTITVWDTVSKEPVTKTLATTTTWVTLGTNAYTDVETNTVIGVTKTLFDTVTVATDVVTVTKFTPTETSKETTTVYTGQPLDRRDRGGEVGKQPRLKKRNNRCKPSLPSSSSQSPSSSSSPPPSSSHSQSSQSSTPPTSSPSPPSSSPPSSSQSLSSPSSPPPTSSSSHSQSSTSSPPPTSSSPPSTCPFPVPTYAAACGDATHYASACSCGGVKATTTTITVQATTVTRTTTVTPTVTATSTKTKTTYTRVTTTTFVTKIATTTMLKEQDVTKTRTQTIRQTKTVTATTTLTLPTCTNKAITATGYTGGSGGKPPTKDTLPFNVRCFTLIQPTNSDCSSSWSSENSVGACASNCASNSGCDAFMFQIATRQCTLFYKLKTYNLVANNGYVSGLQP
ncbi:uncharacterized protein SPSK_00273 [Sporothrix schenckii 1099-18]|uniref:Apple domain-containing protein n=2 Tax=Sporothrix schenckii TaxID=29908 RepID=U7PK11_SPOS1|nr:uncharacterized protein SPSK_00273 [Sporothrix schenckii 1099-18]ERS95877.1 hypothetical protein HMPREF1624_07954 [Sporothrix schenckii ATCC 58251]KJR84025.1 hypothetical protein SPSK_00273 [Sporothrix schenckii 1099-18]